MGKIILSLLFVLLSVPAFAQGIYLPVASGTVTQANMKISAVDGTSFVDFTAANVLTGKTGNLLVVRDSSGRAIQGFIKAAGAGETLDSNIPILATLNLLSGWVPLGSTISDENTFVTTEATGKIYSTGKLTPLALYKSSLSTNETDGITQVGNNASNPVFALDGETDIYRTANGTAVVIENLLGGVTIDILSVSIQKVLTPSATGVTITSTKGGTTFNWAQKNTAFNYNDTSGYKYQIYKVLNAPVVDSDTCTNANATINLTAGSAAWSCTGIDDAAYQDGKHIIAVYDTAGVAAFGYYKASGSGAVVNAKGGATQNWISVGAGFSTAGNYTRKVLYVGD